MSLLLVAGLGAVIIGLFWPLYGKPRPDGGFSETQVWLKTLVIVAYFVIATVFIPAAVVESSLLANPPEQYRDLISSDTWELIRNLVGSGVWLGALVFGFWGLRRGQRETII